MFVPIEQETARMCDRTQTEPQEKREAKKQQATHREFIPHTKFIVVRAPVIVIYIIIIIVTVIPGMVNTLERR